MSTPFLAEIQIMSFNFAPKGWALCNGQLLPINQNQALFSLLGTMYGGDGQTNFALPNLQGRVPIHVGNGHTQGEAGGESSHTLSVSELPAHTHTASATSDAHVASPENYQPVPSGALFGVVNGAYTGATNLAALLPSTLGNVGGSQPHENMQPYLSLSFCIALQGIFPSRN